MGRGFSQGAGSGIMGQGLVGAGRGLVGLRLSLIDLGGACGLVMDLIVWGGN